MQEDQEKNYEKKEQGEKPPPIPSSSLPTADITALKQLAQVRDTAPQQQFGTSDAGKQFTYFQQYIGESSASLTWNQMMSGKQLEYFPIRGVFFPEIATLTWLPGEDIDTEHSELATSFIEKHKEIKDLHTFFLMDKRNDREPPIRIRITTLPDTYPEAELLADYFSRSIQTFDQQEIGLVIEHPDKNTHMFAHDYEGTLATYKQMKEAQEEK